MSAHTCHAYGCEVSTPPRLFMCRRHWAMVPKVMQDRIYETCTHRPGDLANVSQAYLDAARTARLFVRDLESKSPPAGWTPPGEDARQ